MSAKRLFNAFQDYFSLRPEETIREWLDPFDWNLSQRNLPANYLPAADHLFGILPHVGKGERRLVEAIIDAKDALHWRRSYTNDDFDEAFINGYGHVEILGTRGHFASDELAAGIVMFGPETHYPQHWHVAEEVYIPLTSGALWSRDEGPYEVRNSGEFIFHESNMHHGMTMESAPLLAAYIWRGGDLAQKGNY